MDRLLVSVQFYQPFLQACLSFEMPARGLLPDSAHWNEDTHLMNVCWLENRLAELPVDVCLSVCLHHSNKTWGH